MYSKRFVGAALTVAILGFGSIVGVGGWLLHRTQPAPAVAVEHDDGMHYENGQPWADPEPPFPLTCAHPAYCELAVDRVCTIIYVMLNVGTDEQDIVKALTPQHDEINADEFDVCPGFRHYWEPEPVAA